MADRDRLFGSPGFLQTAFEQSPSALMVVDKRTGIILANRQLEALTGYGRDSLEGRRKLTELVLAEDQEMVRNFLKMLKTNETDGSSQYECRFVDSRGELKVAYLSGTFLHDPGTAILSLTDVTAQKKKETELEEARSRAEASDRLKTAFLGNLSHEIRTPMNAIVGFASLIQMEEVDPEKRNLYLSQIIQGSTDLLQLIEKTIVISRIDMGQIKIVNRQFFVNKRMNELKDKYLQALAKAGKDHVELVFEPGHTDEDFLVHADTIRVLDVLNHLLDNAVKFTESGKISFGYAYLEESGERDRDSLLFYVKDTGSGIQADKTGIIFDRFVKLVDSQETVLRGAGLGLAIAQDLVKLMNGDIWVESTPGTGSKFYFSIPVSYSKTCQSPRPQEKQKRKYEDWSSYQLLVAEDVESNYLYIKELLSPTQMNVLRARDGIEAVEIFEKNPDVNLILMDILMPGLDGYEATKKIRQIRDGIPVIAQTAFTFEGEIRDGLYAGCFTDYIMKPFTRDMLLAKIKTHLPSGVG